MSTVGDWLLALNCKTSKIQDRKPKFKKRVTMQNHDPLRAAKGIINGSIFGGFLWILIFAAVYNFEF